MAMALLATGQVADQAMAVVVVVAGVRVLVWVVQVAHPALCPLWPQALVPQALQHLVAGPVVQSLFASEIAPVRMQLPKSE